MGRPLFSQTYPAASSPAVRQPEPEPARAQDPYARWTYWTPFDPDSEEFFVDAEEERVRVGGADETIVVEDMIGSSSSEGSASGRETPVFADVMEPSFAEVVEAGRWATARRALVNANATLDAIAASDDEDEELMYPQLGEDEGHTYRAMQVRQGQSPPSVGFASPRATTSYVRVPHGARRSRSPEPINLPSPSPVQHSTVSAPIAIPARPSTPPNQASWPYGTPSPAPSVTPRLYTWRPPALPIAVSPGSPLPNRSARMSVARISPSAVALQRVIG
ncbi:hypothetical protein BDW22DRAFT_570743 [Trametopsis cervina]|nr:hypothetical protein BDW22DRAFT_570743 [Trametopsis cervina]